MGKLIGKVGVLAMIFLSLGVLHSCENKNPSVVKIFVRSSSNELVSGAKVIIIGDPSSDPATQAYIDTVITNDSGFAYFNVQPYYDAAGEEDNPVAYFDIIAKTDLLQENG